MKRHGSGCPPPNKRTKHKLGYSASWKDEFPWHFPVYAQEGDAESGVSGLMCTICQRHGAKQRNSAGTWTDKPCTYLRRDMLQRHKVSRMHKEAEEHETQRLV